MGKERTMIEDVELERMRFPIGRFEPRSDLSDEERRALIDGIAALPDDLRTAVAGLSPEQLDTPYRPGGWTIRQVVHHLPDSHVNGYTRCKLAVTESEPPVQLYGEAAGAELAGGQTGDVEISLDLLSALHRRWMLFLNSLDNEEFARAGRHPDWGPATVEVSLQLHAWHGRHYLAHIRTLRDRTGR